MSELLDLENQKIHVLANKDIRSIGCHSDHTDRIFDPASPEWQPVFLTFFHRLPSGARDVKMTSY